MWTEARTEVKALRVFERFRLNLDREVPDRSIEPYPKIAGHVVSFWIELESRSWNDAIVEAIALGQRVGYQWTLSGDILFFPEGWSNNSNVPGIRSMHWMMDRRWIMPSA
jgi:hypothetical protein